MEDMIHIMLRANHIRDSDYSIENISVSKNVTHEETPIFENTFILTYCKLWYIVETNEVLGGRRFGGWVNIWIG